MKSTNSIPATVFTNFKILNFSMITIARNLDQDGGRACASYTVMALKVLKIMYRENDFFENISFSMWWIPCAQFETFKIDQPSYLQRKEATN